MFVLADNVLGIHAELTISSTMVLSNAANIEYMHETRRETADGRQGTRPAHYRASKILGKKERKKETMNEGLAPHPILIEVHLYMYAAQ